MELLQLSLYRLKLFVVIEHDTHWICCKCVRVVKCQQIQSKKNIACCVYDAATRLYTYDGGSHLDCCCFELLPLFCLSSSVHSFFSDFFLLVFVAVWVRFCSSRSFVLLVLDLLVDSFIYLLHSTAFSVLPFYTCFVVFCLLSTCAAS